MGRLKPHEKKAELKKGPWTRDEDQKLLAYIQEHGHGSWHSLPAKAGLKRCGKSCRMRWTNYLRPDIKRGKFSSHEEKTIMQLHALLGNRWSAIAAHLPSRTDNEIKNYWNTRLKKRLIRMGIDPVTHKPKNGSGQSKEAASLNHMAQWESARLEAESRLGRDPLSKHEYRSRLIHKTTTPPPVLSPRLGPPCIDILKVFQNSSVSNPFFASNGSFESPKSTLNFNENMLYPNAGSITCLSSLSNVNMCVQSSGACGVGKANVNTVEVKSTMNNSVEFPEINIVCPVLDSDNIAGFINSSDYGYGVASVNEGNFEDYKTFWEDVLSYVDSPIGLPVF